jgi:hypothetical protein
MEGMEVKVEYKDGPCRDFVRNGKKEEVFRTIMPLHIVTEKGKEPDKERISIVSGCSHWWNCENKDCAFSKAVREIKKKKGNFFEK